MKIIACGDTHGRVNWKKIAEKELATCDKFIFIGELSDILVYLYVWNNTKYTV